MKAGKVGKMLTQVPEEPWATVCADFAGPLPRSKHGNQILLVMIDRFSKWTELVLLRSANRKIRGPEGGHNGQRSAVCKTYLQKFPGWDGYQTTIHRTIHTTRKSDQTSKQNSQDCAIRRAGPEKLGREVAWDYASSEHDYIGIHRPYTGVSYPGQGTASTQQPIW